MRRKVGKVGHKGHGSADRRRTTVVLDRVGVGGDAIGTVNTLDYDPQAPVGERRAILVEGGFVGDTVDVEFDAKKRPLRGHLLRVQTPSPHRRTPPCPHAKSCGGCGWMSLDQLGRSLGYASIIEQSLLHALRGAGGAADAATVDALPLEREHHEAPTEDGYRTRARLAVHAGRTVTIGYRSADGRHVVPITSCLVLDPRLAPVLEVLREGLAGATGDGEASVALGRGELPVISLTFTGQLPPKTFGFIEQAVKSGRVAGVDVWLAGTSVPARTGDPSVVTVGGDGQPLEVPAAGFAQANPSMNVRLAEHVRGLLTTPLPTLELHAGAGNLTVQLAPANADTAYETVEAEKAAVTACRANLRARNLSNVKLHEGDAETFDIASKFRRIILDPPRTGARGATARIAASRAHEVIYVSCDPATLARDAAQLVAAGFRAKSLHTFEMFPLTPHVEAVLHLVRS
jgi:23S rRNA (uracil1939-C5)-methyltransferase